MPTAPYMQGFRSLAPKETGPPIDLTGVPTISDHAYHLLATTGELDYMLRVDTDQRIREACAEIQRRKMAIKFRDFQPVFEDDEE